ncbi:hypothetical protein PV08_08347 [Exophiala spinifera]|uniref:Uncharacterized protein n=1 Tax=Exophiala spinifera TaxID=91928 RepID=A0A0D2B3E5_9EURO|nr:uncharacterized protein PV08_08347 [Exophiala spinifera]KIW13160.1 hypothetical protein PV08_08347 [Exophiala spinifera]
MNPTPEERFEEASKHARLINALLSHPACRLMPDGRPHKTQTPLTLYWVIDFELNTWNNYVLPLLPHNAAKNSRALAILPGSDFTERPHLLADDLYPRMSVGGLNEKWSDSVGRSVMITSIILTPGQQMMFGGLFPFGPEVEAAAREFGKD